MPPLLRIYRRSEGDASDSDGSESASDSEQNDPPSSLVADAEQYELMQTAYAAVGKDFQDVAGSNDLIGSKYSKLQKLEMVPERWPLARLSFSLQTCVDHLDRVLAGCCWEVQATRTTPLDTHFPSRSGKVSDHEAGCLFGQRGCRHPQGGFNT